MLVPGKTLKGQLIILLFGLTAIAILVLSFLAVRSVVQSGQQSSDIATGSTKERVKQFMVQTTNATASKTSLVFQGIERESNNVTAYTDDLFNNPIASSWKFDQHVKHQANGQWINSLDEPANVLMGAYAPMTPQIKRGLEITSYLDYLSPQVLKNETNLVAVYYIGLAGESRYYPNFDLASITPPDFNPATQEFFTAGDPAHDPGKTVKWTSVYDDPAGNGLTITATNPIYTTAGSFVGVIGMDVTLNNVAKNITDYSPIESSYAFLIDNQGRAIALPNQGYKDLLDRTAKDKEFGTDLKNVTGDFGVILKNMRAGKSGFSEAKAGNEKLYVAYGAIKDTPFSLGIVAKQSAVLKVVNDLQIQVQNSTRKAVYYQILPFGVMITLVIWLFGFVYIRRITDPIKQLTDNTTRISSGDLNVEPAEVKTDNEIGQLAKSFNHMVGDLRKSRRKIEEQNQQLLHNEQTRLRASINSLNVGFIMTDNQDDVFMLNGVAKKMLAYAGSDDPTRKHHKSSWTVSDVDEVLGAGFNFKSSLEKAVGSGLPVEHKEVRLKEKTLRVFIAPIKDDPGTASHYLGAVVLLEDITEAKILERSRDEFFSIASHELRTPLTAIRGNASLIEQVYKEKLKDADFDAMIGDIHGASVRLIEIVNDFLDATRLEQGRIAYTNESFPIVSIVEEIAKELATVTKEKDDQIIVQKDMAQMPPIFADKNRVKQIIYNLVGNAMKFTNHGTITIRAELDGKMLKVLIADTGPGIAKESQGFLFHKFQQAGNNFLTRESRGTGLGLYISKLLCEQMGGQMGLEESELGKGTVFGFTLPITEQLAAGEGREQK